MSNSLSSKPKKFANEQQQQQEQQKQLENEALKKSPNDFLKSKQFFIEQQVYNKRPFLSANFAEFNLPEDTHFAQFFFSEYYFPAECNYPVPSPQVYAQVSPCLINIDFLTLLWINTLSMSIWREKLIVDKNKTLELLNTQNKEGSQKHQQQQKQQQQLQQKQQQQQQQKYQHESPIQQPVVNKEANTKESIKPSIHHDTYAEFIMPKISILIYPSQLEQLQSSSSLSSTGDGHWTKEVNEVVFDERPCGIEIGFARVCMSNSSMTANNPLSIDSSSSCSKLEKLRSSFGRVYESSTRLCKKHMIKSRAAVNGTTSLSSRSRTALGTQYDSFLLNDLVKRNQSGFGSSSLHKAKTNKTKMNKNGSGSGSGSHLLRMKMLAPCFNELLNNENLAFIRYDLSSSGDITKLINTSNEALNAKAGLFLKSLNKSALNKNAMKDMWSLAMESMWVDFVSCSSPSSGSSDRDGSLRAHNWPLSRSLIQNTTFKLWLVNVYDFYKCTASASEQHKSPHYSTSPSSSPAAWMPLERQLQEGPPSPTKSFDLHESFDIIDDEEPKSGEKESSLLPMPLEIEMNDFDDDTKLKAFEKLSSRVIRIDAYGDKLPSPETASASASGKRRSNSLSLATTMLNEEKNSTKLCRAIYSNINIIGEIDALHLRLTHSQLLFIMRLMDTVDYFGKQIEADAESTLKYNASGSSEIDKADKNNNTETKPKAAKPLEESTRTQDR
jgi:hypothetical protein